MEAKEIEILLSLLKANDVTDFELNKEGVHLKLSRGAKYVAAPTYAPAPVEQAITVASHAPAVAHGSTATATAAAVNPNWVKVESPMVGTFYRKPNPESAVFAAEGAVVKKGQTLCIIEAMKLMNEIESPCDGKVEKILLSDGKVVEFGEVLFLINPNA